MQRLFHSASVGVARRGHPLLRGKMTASRYAAHRHVNASRRGIGWTPIDDALAKLRLRRTVALVVPSFQAALLAAASSPLIATIPEILAPHAARLDLRTFLLPVPLPPTTIFQAWHPRFDADPVHQFIRACVMQACRHALGRVTQPSASNRRSTLPAPVAGNASRKRTSRGAL